MKKSKHFNLPPFFSVQYLAGTSVFILLFFTSTISLSQTIFPFPYTGGVQTFTVPSCVYTIHVKAWGGGGSGGGGDDYPGAVGGGGAFVESDLTVVPGQVITLIVGGGAGPGGQCASCAPGGSTGWGNGLVGGGNGGNAGCSGCSGGGGGGGGAAALYSGATPWLVAGGGGGGSGGGQFSSGAIGGGGGQDGNPSPGSCSSFGVSGASANGNGDQGANKSGDGGGGGGGGGGYNGGTGGGVATGCDCGACGGGGGGCFSSGTNTTITNGTGQTAGNSADLDLPSGASNGGNGSTKGGDGFILLSMVIPSAPTAVFTVVSPVCDGANSTVTYIGSGSGSAVYNWDFNGGAIVSGSGQGPYTVNWASGGSKNITLDVSENSCTHSGSMSVTVNPLPTAAISGTTALCENGAAPSIAFTGAAGTAPYTFTYTLNGGASQTITTSSGNSVSISAAANAAGIFTYALVSVQDASVSNCSNTAAGSAVITINPLPAAIISGTATVCQYDAAPLITFTGSGSTAPYTFTYSINGGASQTITTTSGNSVTLPVSTGAPASFTYTLISVQDASSTACSVAASGSVSVTIYPKPNAGFRNTSVCAGNPTQFTDSSFTASGTISLRTWNFGDSSPFSNLLNPSHQYAAGGIYNTSLIISNSFGCLDTIIKPVHVYYNPVASFTHSDVCLGDTIHFTNTSTINNTASIANYLWQFGDASPTSNAQSPPHYYSAAGINTVTLVTTSSDGCTDAVTVSAKTFDAPVSAFAFSSICLYDSAHFTNSTISPAMGSTAGWSWNFGDGSPVNTTVWSPSHIYSVPGNYQVTLITHSSNLGCPDTITHPITAFPIPVARFVFTNVCLNQAMNFNDSSIVSSGSIASCSWNFGDGSSPNANPNPAHIYANTGIHTVSLIVTTNNGCKDTVSKSTVVHPLPHAAIAAQNVCDGSTVYFSDSSHIPPTDTIHSWGWNFADGSPLNTNKNTSHLYAGAGSYIVQLLVVTNFGCPDSITKVVFVNPNPVVNFSADDTIGCEPLCVNFHNIPSSAPGTNAAWLWNFGDGSPAVSLQNPRKCYIDTSVFSPALLNVTLKVTSDSGCSSIKTKNNYITVYPNPEAVFSALPGSVSIVNPVISVTDQSVGTNYWHWNFGDLDTAVIKNPLPHTYADTGTYLITLIASTQYNCADTAYQTIVIEPDFLFYIPNTFTPNDDGINDTFLGRGIFIKEYEMMIFDRWGNLIFYSNDMSKGWDGKANHGSDTAQHDVYVYSVNVTDFKNKKHSYKGVVTLIR